MNYMKKLTLVANLLLLALGNSLFSQESALMKADALSKIYNTKDVVLVEARKPEDYSQVHINGAVNIYYKELIDKAEYDKMKKPEDLAALFGSKGISEKSTVIIYDDGTMKGAAFTWWILKYLGAEKVYILDGGIDAWKAARKPVTSQPTKITPAVFTMNLSPSIYASKDYFLGNFKKPGLALVDARENDQYKGEKGTTTRKGHIPGATNIMFSDLVAKGFFKSKEEILSMMKNAGFNPDQEYIVYCNSGIKAAVDYFAFTEIAGIRNIKLYAGSFNEWESNPDNIVIQ
jgi:thiosulfate/3-mercaptopyruvate sulfurtransferase